MQRPPSKVNLKSVLKFGGSVGPGSAYTVALYRLCFESLPSVEFVESLSTVEFVTAIAGLAKIAMNANALTEGSVISMAVMLSLKECVSRPYL